MRTARENAEAAYQGLVSQGADCGAYNERLVEIEVICKAAGRSVKTLLADGKLLAQKRIRDARVPNAPTPPPVGASE